MAGNKSSSHGIYNNQQLLQMVAKLGHKAQINKRGQLVTMAGAPLVYNYADNVFEFLTSSGQPMYLGANSQFYKYDLSTAKGRQVKNSLAFPAIYQSIHEDKAFVDYRNREDHKRAIPYIDNKVTTVSKGKSKDVSFSTNLIDSIRFNLRNVKDQQNYLGIASRETDIGKYPAYTFNKKVQKNTPNHFKMVGSVTPAYLVNNHAYFISPMRGTLNTIFKEEKTKHNDRYIGSPYAHFLLSEYLNFNPQDEWLKKQEDNLIYQRSRGVFNPDVKKSSGDYYNPEDNPYLNAVQQLRDRNYGMGPRYPAEVNEDVIDINYLLRQ